MAAGNVVTITGTKHTYVLVDADTSLAPHARSLVYRYKITVDGVDQPYRHSDISRALRDLGKIINVKERVS